MPAQTLATTAIVLDRKLSGESWQRLTCLSLEHGQIDCLQRLSRRKAGTTPGVDLFDELQLSLETRNNGRTWFIREALPVRRRPGLGTSYDALRHACRFARLLTANPASDESRESIMRLLERALDAWEQNHRPDAVYFKCAFLFTREEGYPVREDWWRRLNRADCDQVDAILREPANAQTSAPEDVARLSAALEAYVRHETDLKIDLES